MILLNLKKLREAKAISQQKLADNIGVSRSTIAMWETNASEPDNTMLKKLATYFDVTVDYILGREDQPQKKGVKIPVLGKVIAGIPIDAIEEIIDYEEITEEMARTGEFFALKIKGTSMSPRIEENDVVIVRKQSTAENGDVAIVLVNGDEAACKKIQYNSTGLTLISFNPSFEPMFYTKEECATLPVKIIGKVVELRGKL